MKRRLRLVAGTLCGLSLLLAGCVHAPARSATSAPPPASATNSSYDESSILQEASAFLGKGARGMARVVNQLFQDNGPPDAYIKGEEVGGAFGIGVRYGHGTLYYKDGTSTTVYWRGPSLGIDLGASASKSFILIYHLPAINALYQRFGGVEGSLYFVGGVGFTYNRNNDILIAPVRLGVGWRQGISVGYLHFSKEKTWLPF